MTFSDNNAEQPDLEKLRNRDVTSPINPQDQALDSSGSKSTDQWTPEGMCWGCFKSRNLRYRFKI